MGSRTRGVAAPFHAQLDRREIATEHHVALTGFIAVRVGIIRPDDQVVDAVAVHVPGRADRAAGGISRIDAVEHEARAAVPAASRQKRAELELCGEGG